ncbi:MAG: hypothetical protein GY757_09905 [bacterium]|nr:hypothetical protein [bacterium]
MKARIVLIFLIVALTMSCGPKPEAPKPAPEPKKVEPKNMEKIMDMPWGIGIDEFLTTFKHRNRLEIETPKLLYRLNNFKLGSAWVELTFYFTDSGLVGTTIDMRSKDFEGLLKVFETKYGKPTNYKETGIQNGLGAKFTQKTAIWLNEQIKREIIIEKYTEGINLGMVAFSPWDPDGENKNKSIIKEAAKEL